MKEGMNWDAMVPEALAEPMGAQTGDDPSELSQVEAG